MFLKISQNSQGSTCFRVSFLMKLQAKACSFIKKETLAEVFSCKFGEIFKNTFFTEHLQATASDKKNEIRYKAKSYKYFRTKKTPLISFFPQTLVRSDKFLMILLVVSQRCVWTLSKM